MSFNFSQSRIVSEVLANLPGDVERAKDTAPAHEHDTIELAAQYIHFMLKDAEPDALAEIQAHGSETPSAGAKIGHVSVNVRRIKAAPAAEEPKKRAPWTPDQGPLTRASSSTPTPGAIDPSVASGDNPQVTGSAAPTGTVAPTR